MGDGCGRAEEEGRSRLFPLVVRCSTLSVQYHVLPSSLCDALCARLASLVRRTIVPTAAELPELMWALLRACRLSLLFVAARCCSGSHRGRSSLALQGFRGIGCPLLSLASLRPVHTVRAVSPAHSSRESTRLLTACAAVTRLLRASSRAAVAAMSARDSPPKPPPRSAHSHWTASEDLELLRAVLQHRSSDDPEDAEHVAWSKVAEALKPRRESTARLAQTRFQELADESTSSHLSRARAELSERLSCSRTGSHSLRGRG